MVRTGSCLSCVDASVFMMMQHPEDLSLQTRIQSRLYSKLTAETVDLRGLDGSKRLVEFKSRFVYL